MNKIKVLIADDEPMLQEIYSMILEAEFNCDFFRAENGNEAIELIKNQGPFDLILSDYKMPEANGGKVFLYNKTLHNTPFILFSGGFLQDFAEFSDFYQVNPANKFLGKPFDEEELLVTVRKIFPKTNAPLNTEQDKFIKVNLRHYILYTTSAAEVYIKLAQDKFTKIIDANDVDAPEKDLLMHYLDKGLETVYVDKRYFTSLMRDAFAHLQEKLLANKKRESSIEFGGLPFKVCFEGLNEIGIPDFNIQYTNELIGETVREILSDDESKERFRSYCSLQGFAVGHSLLIMYIASGLCHEAGLNFQNTMKKICTASFFHDFPLFETDASEDCLPLESAKHPDHLFNHPVIAASFLPKGTELFDDTAKIILEHHERPGGNGYPKKLNSFSISPLGCLFILSEEITFNLIRNDFDCERLRDFLGNIKEEYSSGNFARFFKASETIFGLST